MTKRRILETATAEQRVVKSFYSRTLRGFDFSRFQAAFREAALSHAILSRGHRAQKPHRAF
ncbi:MAG: hypothetical protein MSG64_17505 [Pyrinomonadaceae bacterium MAG19_C2-C3]|nr:hypothetical protein [Pyrinomonadaceae bacterium MAG19_C2-C3]